MRESPARCGRLGRSGECAHGVYLLVDHCFLCACMASKARLFVIHRANVHGV